MLARLIGRIAARPRRPRPEAAAPAALPRASPHAGDRTDARTGANAHAGTDARTGASANAGISPDAADAVGFTCNVCSTPNVVARSALSREVPSCAGCASTVRFRAIARLVVLEMLGVEAALPQLTPRRDLRGLGLSDDTRYAAELARAFDYTNTWYHTEPRLDIAAVPARERGRYDFVIASDVFEHVPPPVSRAFDGARALLKPGGVLVFTVPFTLGPATVEHFPELREWQLAQEADTWCLHNVTADGRRQRFDSLVFHGGPGSTLEMRVFCRDDLLRAFAAAGFARVRIADEACAAFGIEWPEPWSVPMVAYAA
jgi:SAM-dependent methyltransferase